MRTIPNIALSVGIVSLLSLGIILLSSWKSPQVSKKVTSEDTTKNADKKKSAKHSRTTIITFDEKGEPHEKIIEDFEGDEGLRELMKGDTWFNFNNPNVPPVPNFPAVPSIPNFQADVMFQPMPPMPPMLFDMGTIDFKQFHLGDNSFEGFGEEFEAMMEDRFKDFGPDFEASMERMHEQLKKMDSELKQLDGFNEGLEKDMERLNETLEHDLKIDLDRINEELEVLHGSWIEGVKEFEKEAQKELIKDGYLDESEKIESMFWSDDEIKFNNQAIKPEHVDKYQEMQKKYTKRNQYRGRPE